MNAGRAAVGAALLVGAVCLGASPAAAVDTDMAISTTAIDFGVVAVGVPAAPVAVTLTNTGGSPFGPINMFGGAPPTAEYNASQNCQGVTLPAGGSCQVTYTFTPSAPGLQTDSSNFTISGDATQANGEDFSVALTGCGAGAGCTPTPTTTTTVATTTTATPTATAPPNDPAAPGNAPPGNPGAPGSPDQIGGTPTTAAALVELDASVRRSEAAPGQEQNATVRGFQPGEAVSAVQQPDGRDLGSQIADGSGVVSFVWTIEESDAVGSHEFVATGAVSGSVSAPFTVVETAEAAQNSDSDSGTSALLIALIVVLVLAATAAAVVVYRRRRTAVARPTSDSDTTAQFPET